MVAAGMAKPMFCALVPSLSVPATAVFMPMNRRRSPSSGPPELPGLIAASVWIMLFNVSLAVPDDAVTVRPSADTMPEGDGRGARREAQRVTDCHDGVASHNQIGTFRSHGGKVLGVVDTN